ncbi:hypothetical protein ACN4EK_00455 [Pantanalinema rosaneae CENA516]|uniref:hypothetical protein n=1 Tax=Pantanalinema rosaneae TaxID=1620701 RepID=UPI003D6E6303
MKKTLWQALEDQQAERLSAGSLRRLEQEFATELVVVQTTTARQPEAEGKIRGTLLLSLP